MGSTETIRTFARKSSGSKPVADSTDPSSGARSWLPVQSMSPVLTPCDVGREIVLTLARRAPFPRPLVSGVLSVVKWNRANGQISVSFEIFQTGGGRLAFSLEDPDIEAIHVGGERRTALVRHIRDAGTGPAPAKTGLRLVR